MALVTWDKTYSVSVRKMDEQHQKLFALINKLHDAMKQGHGQATVEETVRELVAYTASHFRAEEEVLRKANYPGFAAHQLEHQKYIAKVNQFAEDIKSGKPASSIAVLGFLKDWLADHIKRTDRSYSAHLNAQGVN
jgi:hemerythrin-like metal-binding protein